MARHDEKTSADRAKMLSGSDTGDGVAQVDEVLIVIVLMQYTGYPPKFLLKMTYSCFPGRGGALIT